MLIHLSFLDNLIFVLSVVFLLHLAGGKLSFANLSVLQQNSYYISNTLGAKLILFAVAENKSQFASCG